MSDYSDVNIQNPRAPMYPPERVLNERGFAEYGEEFDTYGTPFRVTQSSAIEDAVWVFVAPNDPGAAMGLHLSPDNVRWLRERLGEYLDDIAQPRDVPQNPPAPTEPREGPYCGTCKRYRGKHDHDTTKENA